MSTREEREWGSRRRPVDWSRGRVCQRDLGVTTGSGTNDSEETSEG